jgi:hypothetical protein
MSTEPPVTGDDPRKSNSPPAIPAAAPSAPPPIPSAGDSSPSLTPPQAVAQHAAGGAKRMLVKPHEEFERPALDMLRTFKVSETILGMMGWVGGTLLAGLIFPQSVLVMVPLLVMIGIWMLVIAHRFKSLLPGNFLAKAFSKKGRVALHLYILGCSPLPLLFTLPNISRSKVQAATRVLLVGYTVLFVPIAGYALIRVRELLAKASS